MEQLWSANNPAQFWGCQDTVSEQQYLEAIRRALPVLELPGAPDTPTELAQFILGEGQFGAQHWEMSWAKQLYYLIKPILPRALTCAMRQVYGKSQTTSFSLKWPIEERYVHFQWEILRQLLLIKNVKNLMISGFWPHKNNLAFVLTHDIETSEGQAFVRRVAELEEELGFRSSFNFVPERYDLDRDLLQELVERGFEVGVHGLKHDGKLFRSYKHFLGRAERINQYLREFNAVGFRSPLTHRNPYWMQALEIEYDLSFFDTDPHEPIAGGTMSIWPFMLGRFVELPYTLVQDYTLVSVIGESTPQVWLDKVDFIKQYHGMALLNTHPDYLQDPKCWQVYVDFLETVKAKYTYWQALPHDVAQWWKARMGIACDDFPIEVDKIEAILKDGHIILT